MSHNLPQQIGKYTISGVLGRGAMGVVYKGFDPHIQRPVAIKTVHKSLLGDDGEIDSIAARFRNEAKAVGRIAHAGIVAIYELGQDESTAFIAMEFVEGRNLEQVLAGTPLLGEAQVISIVDQLLDALDCAHRNGVWHRDIKPANLLLTADGQLKLTDFGIARIENAGLTQIACVIGTPGYMAPEQYIGDDVDHRADLFAVGVLLYHLLAGRAPFTGRPDQVMYQVLNEEAAPPSSFASQARHEAYDAVVSQAMAKHLPQRFASAADFRQALAAAARLSDSSDGNATVLVEKAQWLRTLTHAKQAFPTPKSQGSQGNVVGQSSPTHLAHPSQWDAPTLSRIERSLASYVGPMAKFMVRDAVRSCTDVHSLTSALALHIGEGQKRQKFMDEANAPSQATPLPRTAVRQLTPTPVAPSAASLRPDAPLSDAIKAHATQVLTRQLGPIAKILVKRAGERAHGRAQFLELLIEACPENDRAVLRAELEPSK